MKKRIHFIIYPIIVFTLSFSPGFLYALTTFDDFQDDFGIVLSSTRDQAPEFSAKTLKGQTVRLSQFSNKIVILNFWVSWCLPCIQEMPHIQDLDEKLPDDQFTILSINVKDRIQRVEKLLKKTFFKLNVVLDSSGSIYQQYHIRNFPTAIIIDRQGQLLGRIEGKRDWSEPQLLEYLKYLYQVTGP